jgi:hypothetical protein
MASQQYVKKNSFAALKVTSLMHNAPVDVLPTHAFQGYERRGGSEERCKVVDPGQRNVCYVITFVKSSSK